METHLKQGSEAWKVWRRNKITATDCAVIMEISPYKTKDQLLQEKIKGFEQTPNAWMRKGVELEPIALKKFEEETGLLLFPMVLEHKTIPWMVASMDGVSIEKTEAIEIKCNGKKNHDIAKKGKPVDFHFCQLQHQMEVCELDMIYYYSFNDDEGVIIEVKRDNDFIEIMLEKEYAFWQRLQALNEAKAV